MVTYNIDRTMTLLEEYMFLVRRVDVLNSAFAKKDMGRPKITWLESIEMTLIY